MTGAARTATRRGRSSSRDTKGEGPPSPLRELADYMHIVPEYVDQTGSEVRVTSDDTRRALLSAF